MNNYPKHVGDYIRDTVGLTMREDGAYNRLLDQYYAREECLPASRAEIYRMARAQGKAERAAVDYVLDTFFVLLSNGYHQKRADEVITEFAEKSGKAKAAAHARWLREHSEGDADASTEVMRTHEDTSCERNASQKPEANSHIPLPTPVGRGGTQLRGTRLPENWELPEEWRSWAAQERPEWPETHLLRVALGFRDFWHAKAGQHARKVDWFATWRTWVRHERSAPRAPPSSGKHAVAAQLFPSGAHTDGRSEEPRDITSEGRRIA